MPREVARVSRILSFTFSILLMSQLSDSAQAQASCTGMTAALLRVGEGRGGIPTLVPVSACLQVGARVDA